MPTNDVTIYEQPTATGALTLHNDPMISLRTGQQLARALWSYAEAGGALMTLKGRKYLRAEGWLFLAQARELTVRITDVRKIASDPDIYQSTAEVLNADGRVVGGGIGICGRDEKTWKDRDTFALISMSQTRATTRALRTPLSWIATLAGCEATGADELPPEAEVLNPNPSAGNASSRPSYEQTANRTDARGDVITEPQRRALFAITADLGKDNAARLALFNGHLAPADQIPSEQELRSLSKRVAGLLISTLGAKADAADIERLRAHGGQDWVPDELLGAVHAGLTELGFSRVPDEIKDLSKRQIDLLCHWFKKDETLQGGRTPLAYPEGTTANDVYPERWRTTTLQNTRGETDAEINRKS